MSELHAADLLAFDTETSGLDPRRDRLLAIGAVAVDGQGIRLGDSFEAVVRTEGVGTPDNVVVHGIGHETQRAGMPVAAALRAATGYALPLKPAGGWFADTASDITFAPPASRGRTCS